MTALRTTLTTLAAAALSGNPAAAADALTDAMTAAYAPYRAALFKTNSGPQAEAQAAITQARQAWAQIVARYGPQPPAPYDRDPAVGTALAEVARVYDKAAEEIAANRLKDAHETLEHAREVQADLRRRNQVQVFSDHMNAYHAEMEQVLEGGAALLAQPGGTMPLMARTGVLKYLGARLQSEAPAELARQEGFGEAARAVARSVAELEAALLAQDQAAAKAALGRIKPAYSRMFLKFG